MKMKPTSPKWKDNLIQIKPYTPGEQIKVPDLIKLNTNENPFPPSHRVQSVIRTFCSKDLPLYPAPDVFPLKKAIAEYSNAPIESVFVGNGSDEVLAFAFRAFFNSTQPVLFPDITYSFYPVWCHFFGIPYEEIALDSEFRIRIYEYNRPNGGVVIANPNAPTGIGEGPEFVEYLIKSNQDSVVIVDEAYVDFGGYSAIPLVGKYDNLLVTRTFSKARALAGMRLGYCIGSSALIAAMHAVKDSFNSYTVSSLAAAAGVASLSDETYFRAQVERIMRLRYIYMKKLRALGFVVLESVTNFLFVSHEKIPARALYEFLKSKNILVRYFDKPRVDQFLRITIGTKESMDKLIEGILEFTEGRQA
ncbi:MAG: histidinol-phosphate transaminase [Clostridiales Family XIII bacterium]|jgi:histidinol-phosphate aminotransferase|nr:histidinol-phosphate transaminase [Clostridiales Family XIII bacterium]